MQSSYYERLKLVITCPSESRVWYTVQASGVARPTFRSGGGAGREPLSRGLPTHSVRRTHCHKLVLDQSNYCSESLVYFTVEVTHNLENIQIMKDFEG